MSLSTAFVRPALCCLLALALPLQAQVSAQGAAPLPAPAAPAAVRLPALGESAAEDFTVGTERRLGDQIMGEIRRDPDYLDDPVLLEYLQSLWQPLVEAARARGDIDVDVSGQFAWEAFLVRDRSVNAFALPGGFVGVHLGMIAMTASRDELASVLAHELSHVTQRHIARSIASQQRQSLLGMAGLILALLAAGRSGNPDVAQAALVGGQAALIQGQLNFSRDMEREADRIGFAVLDQAGYQPGGMAAMFEKLDNANRLNDNGAFPYLRSHPLTLERQSEARMRLQGLPPHATKTVSPLLHALMAARARVLVDTSVTALRRQQDLPALRPGHGAAERLAGLYSSALASSLLRDHAMAEQRNREARALLAETPGADAAVARSLWLLDAEGRLAAGDLDGAAKVLADARQRWPDAAQARPPLLMQAQAALQTRPPAREERLRQSTEALQTWVAEHPRDAYAWLLLGNTAEALGLRLRALRAQAESRLLVGDLRGAMDRLRSGRQLARSGVSGQDFIEASIIDARLREMENQRRQLAAEQRGGRGGDKEPPADRDDAPPRLQQPLFGS
ncbi:MAG: M48 family metalloprotease [Proteobacteria bacterium]|nr:M48 family metalloprotease [Pseudomonadota bacterium]